jgi:hypothetical protein
VGESESETVGEIRGGGRENDDLTLAPVDIHYTAPPGITTSTTNQYTNPNTNQTKKPKLEKQKKSQKNKRKHTCCLGKERERGGGGERENVR